MKSRHFIFALIGLIVIIVTTYYEHQLIVTPEFLAAEKLTPADSTGVLVFMILIVLGIVAVSSVIISAFTYFVISKQNHFLVVLTYTFFILSLLNIPMLLLAQLGKQMENREKAGQVSFEIHHSASEAKWS